MLDGSWDGFSDEDAKAVLRACEEARGGMRSEFSIAGTKVVLSPATGGRGPFKGVLIVTPDLDSFQGPVIQGGVRSLTLDGVRQAILEILVDLVHQF